MAAKRKTKAEAEAPAIEAAPEPVVASIKGFDLDWTCRGFQFEVGKTYTVDGPIEACKNGFHACPDDTYPLSVFKYYPPAGARFADVTQSGASHRDGNKLASACITIGVEISLGELVARAVKWVWDRATLVEGSTATGVRGAASATGYSGAASATGYSGAASATGYSGAASATGYSGAASATGVRGAASATGDSGAASATGDSGAASATGKHSVALATGCEGRAMAGETGAICLVCRDDRTGAILAVRASKVCENGVKPGVWYSLNAAGEFVEEVE